MATTQLEPAGIQYQLAIPLPKSISTSIHIHLTIESHHVLLFLTSRAPESPPGSAQLGSFVYALKSTTQPTPLSTPLYVRENTIETATLIARMVAAKTGLPTYVGCSIDLSSAGRGGSVEEVLEAVKNVAAVVVSKVAEAKAARVAQ